MKTSILFVTAAFALVPACGFAAEVKAQSDSVASIEALPSKSYTSTSIAAFGAPPEKKEEVKRRHAVGFVPKIPPAPETEKAEDEKQAMVSQVEPAKAEMGEGEMEPELDIGELKGTQSGDETESVDAESGEHQIGELRTE